MKKIIILSVILLNGILTPSLFGMFKNVARRMQLCKVQKRKCTSKKKNENLNLSLIEPEVCLKSPKMVLDNIDSYWNHTNGIYEDEKFVKHIEKAPSLLIDALLASHMCNEICIPQSENKSKNQLSWMQQIKSFFCKKNSDLIPSARNTRELRLANHHRFMNAWHKAQMEDPKIGFNKIHSCHIDYNTHDKIQRGIYQDMNGWDLKTTEECKERLAQEIIYLHQYYTYLKEDAGLKDKNKNNE